MDRNQLYDDPSGLFLHDAVLRSCERFGEKLAIIDTSDDTRLSFAELGHLIRATARGLVEKGLRPGEVVAICLPNCWEYCVLFHAITVAGGIPSPINPSYREREVRYQLEKSTATFLFASSQAVAGMDLSQIATMRQVHALDASHDLSFLLKQSTVVEYGLPNTVCAPKDTVAVLPYSSGTTSLPKGVLLTHSNVVTNIFQSLPPGELATLTYQDRALLFLPLYHIYGLNVILNSCLVVGATVILMPRFDVGQVLRILTRENITFLPVVPPVLSTLCQAAESRQFPRVHSVRHLMSGAAPLAAELAIRFENLTGIPTRQGYGMTEASPVTHLGYIEKDLYNPGSVGRPVALTECRVVREDGLEAANGELGELVMRGPQFMRGYWGFPEATAEVFRDGWYWSGDIGRIQDGFCYIVDRRKDMLKYKGFSVAPAEIEAVLMEHRAVLDCGVVGRPDPDAGESPCAFVVLRHGYTGQETMRRGLIRWVAERLSGYKHVREVQFLASIPRTPSGKILRRQLRGLA
jgi:acyl-CoA synthetase (AMP-forming)/AMP-acid ligase II